MGNILSTCCNFSIDEPTLDELIELKSFDISLLNNVHNILIVSNDDIYDEQIINNILAYKSICNGCIISNSLDIMFENNNRHRMYYPITLYDILNTKCEEIEKKQLSRTYLFLDNVINEKNANDDSISKIINNTASNQILLLIRSNYISTLIPKIKDNIEYIFIKADQYIDNIESIYNQFIKNIFHITLSAFIELFNKYEYVHNVYLVIDCKPKNKQTLDNSIFTYLY
jgi:hypothetical protein